MLRGPRGPRGSEAQLLGRHAGLCTKEGVPRGDGSERSAVQSSPVRAAVSLPPPSQGLVHFSFCSPLPCLPEGRACLPLPSTGYSWARVVTQWDRPPSSWALSSGPWNWNPERESWMLPPCKSTRGPPAGCFPPLGLADSAAARSDLPDPRASAPRALQ